MRYPVTNTGSKEEFESLWRIDQTFGNPTSYGFHEGVDINLKTGGDTDLNQELKSIANGKIVYYHYASHPSSAFGRHLVVRIDGEWGSRWVHFAHCSEIDFKNSVQDVAEGQVIARLGKSGNSPTAHLHFAIYKVDPATNGGIDNFANNIDELNAVWEDPIAFIDKWMAVPVNPPITEQSKFDFGNPWGVMEMQQTRSKLNDQLKEINDQKIIITDLVTKIDKIREILG